MTSAADGCPERCDICDICGKHRPDACIDVYVRVGKVTASSTDPYQTVRYCNDRRACIRTALRLS